ncbi:MAG: hypothetical protein EHM49_02110 [Deltaproteobacteria bacterium]|nr:MAG: hypothetical protein EHM49_02110 [Deltaproteobacteria bacterium]
MSETALTLIQDALFEIGVLAEGETATNAMAQHGLRRLRYMLRRWSAQNIRLYYTEQDTLVLTGVSSYTIGSGGDCDTVRPSSIRGGFVRGSGGLDQPIKIVDEDKYRKLSIKDLSSTPEFIWYNPEYPLGKIYIWPIGTGTLYLDSLKPLTDPATLTTSMSFPPEYDEAFVCGLAVRLAPNYGKSPSEETKILAIEGLRAIESKNFNEQMVAARPEIIDIAGKWLIDVG